MKMIHWLTLEETESQVTSDDGGVKLDAPDDGTVHVSLRSDYAAAPKLLEACRFAEALAVVSCPLGVDVIYWEQVWSKIRAAIAEADSQE